jgi:hypothetical protein
MVDKPMVMETLPCAEPESVTREKVTNMIAEHGFTAPVYCFLDEFKYLKSSQNTYLFDQMGELIKMSNFTFIKFCEEGLLK